ncbi:hypothetical protein ERJ71_19075 [Paenibacillus polymyxa]|nr:hypothetical protein ERJ71_19075 [Paenibacillus polymyxa]
MLTEERLSKIKKRNLKVKAMKSNLTSHNIHIQAAAPMEPWSAGGIREGISADNLFGVHEYRNVIRNQREVGE